MAVYEVFVEGHPVPWGMGREIRVQGKRRRAPGKGLDTYQKAIGWAWRSRHKGLVLAGPVALDMEFLTISSRSDTTNLAKGAEDGLKHVAFGDDVLVYSIKAVKRPVGSKAEEGTQIKVSQWTGDVHPNHMEA